MRFLLICVCATSLFAQTASFPEALPGDTDLLQAPNRSETQLTAGIDSVTLSLPVQSTAGFKTNMMVTIENERLKICGISGNLLNVCAGGRGFDESTAASHTSGRSVRGQVSAWYHNRMAAEVKAIATALGPKMRNLPNQTGHILTTTYDFTPQNPLGLLVSGVLASVSLNPCPVGVAGSDTNHLLYISGGTGTAETVLIQGGSCVSGAASGTVFFTPSYTHSGAWTIESASDGLDEAIRSLNNAGGTVVYPAGSFNIKGPVTYAGSGLQIRGSQVKGTFLRCASGTGQGCIRFVAASPYSGIGNGLSDLTMLGDDANTAMLYAVTAKNQRDFRAGRLWVDMDFKGSGAFQLDTCFMCSIEDTTIFDIKATTGIGIHITQTTETPDQFLNRIYIDHTLPCGIACEPFAGIAVSGSGKFYLTHSDIAHAGTGLMIAPGAGEYVIFFDVGQTSFDQNASAGIRIQPASGGSVRGGTFLGTWSSSNGVGIAINQTGTGTVSGLTFTGLRLYNNYGSGFDIAAGTNPANISDITVGGGSRIAGNTFTKAGTVSTNGLFVTRLTGDQWNTTMGGRTLTIAGVPYTVDQIYTADLLTLTTTAGVQASAAYAFGTAPGSGISIANGIGKITVTGVSSGAMDSFPASQAFGIYAQSNDNLLISGNDLRGNTTSGFSVGGTFGSNVIVTGNLPYDSTANLSPRMSGVPTGCSGKPADTVWSDLGVLKLCP